VLRGFRLQAEDGGNLRKKRERPRRALSDWPIETETDGYLMNSISRYVGSGQTSCGTMHSSASPDSRSEFIAGMTLSRKYFACFSALPFAS
jgi:hypothetical protein